MPYGSAKPLPFTDVHATATLPQSGENSKGCLHTQTFVNVLYTQRAHAEQVMYGIR